MGNDYIMTVDEIAEYLRLKKVTVYKMSQEKRIPAFKVGSTWRYKRSTIESWIAKKETGNVK